MAIDVTPSSSAPFLTGESETCILVVDDEAPIRDLCAKALKGYRVLEAATGDEALELLAQGGIDLILTDVKMPTIDGLHLLKRIKELQPTQIVIMMTGFADKDVILDALKSDADDFIAKPLNLLQLRSTVEKTLVKKALKEEIANLKNIDRLKSNFLSLISHKFRTPITVISLFMQELESSGLIANLGMKKSLAGAFEETVYLERLVKDLLVFSRLMDSGDSLTPEPCDLESIVLQAVRQTRNMIRKPGIESNLDLESIPPLLLDREKISFAVRQIVENAFKFSDEPGRVSVALRRMDDIVQIVIKDEGRGIPPEELPKIFEKFYQIDSDNTGQVPGFGLGLFYAREFIRQHSGTITVESRPGSGTLVAVTIPFDDE